MSTLYPPTTRNSAIWVVAGTKTGRQIQQQQTATQRQTEAETGQTSIDHNMHNVFHYFCFTLQPYTACYIPFCCIIQTKGNPDHIGKKRKKFYDQNGQVYTDMTSRTVVCLPLQMLLERAITRAGQAADSAFLARAAAMRGLLLGLRCSAEAYLREYLRRIAAAARLNEACRGAWQHTPLVGGVGLRVMIRFRFLGLRVL